MIRIYSANGEECHILNRDNEDSTVAHLTLSSMCLYASWVSWLLKSPIQLIILFYLMLSPAILYDNGDMMNAEEIAEKVAQIVEDKKKFIKLDARWAYKPDYQLATRTTIALVRLRDGGRVAMPHLEPRRNENEEFIAALKIIKEVERLKSKS